MEVFNSKLMEKYHNLKKRKASEVDDWLSGENSKLRNYHLAMEKIIDSLKKENNQLHDQILLKEDDYAKCQSLLMEEKEKTKELSHEVKKLSSLLSERSNSNSEKENLLLERNRCIREKEDNESPTLDLSYRSPRGRSRTPSHISAQEMTADTSIQNCEEPVQKKHCEVQNEQIAIARECWEQVVPDCCKNYKINSGDASVSCHFSCIFQTLVESIVGAKFSIESHEDLPHLSVTHQSSGYSFGLTWLRSVGKEEGVWLYHVVSLGTLEGVALEWMREDILFSSSMCPIFFERVSRFIGRCH